MLRGKPFWFSSLGQQVQFGVFQNFVELLVELHYDAKQGTFDCNRSATDSILVTSGGLKKH